MMNRGGSPLLLPSRERTPPNLKSPRCSRVLYSASAAKSLPASLLSRVGRGWTTERPESQPATLLASDVQHPWEPLIRLRQEACICLERGPQYGHGAAGDSQSQHGRVPMVHSHVARDGASEIPFVVYGLLGVLRTKWRLGYRART